MSDVLLCLVNCEINLFLTWSSKFLLADDDAVTGVEFTKEDGELYVPLIILSSKDGTKPLEQLKPAFEMKIFRF